MLFYRNSAKKDEASAKEEQKKPLDRKKRDDDEGEEGAFSDEFDAVGEIGLPERPSNIFASSFALNRIGPLEFKNVDYNSHGIPVFHGHGSQNSRGGSSFGGVFPSLGDRGHEAGSGRGGGDPFGGGGGGNDPFDIDISSGLGGGAHGGPGLHRQTRQSGDYSFEYDDYDYGGGPHHGRDYGSYDDHHGAGGRDYNDYDDYGGGPDYGDYHHEGRVHHDPGSFEEDYGESPFLPGPPPRPPHGGGFDHGGHFGGFGGGGGGFGDIGGFARVIVPQSDFHPSDSFEDDASGGHTSESDHSFEEEHPFKKKKK